MMIKVKTLVLSVSLLFNALAVTLLISAIAGNTSSFSFYRMDGGIAAAMIVSVPLSSGSVTFNPVEITLSVGESAFLQIAGAVEGRQVNWIIQALYDRRIISVSQNSGGITITAVNSGECVLQTFTNDGITDVAIIRVAE